MNKYITHLLAFAAGAGIAVLATNKYYKNFYRERADAEVEDMRDAFERKLEQYEPVKEFVDPPEEKDCAEIARPENPNPYHNLVKPRLYDMAAKYEDQEFETHLESTEYPEDDAPEEYEDPFEEVDQEAYFAFGGETEDLTYYAQDDILVDSNNQIIPDASVVVGEEGLTLFDHGKDVVYIWNHDLDIIFQITRLYKRWLVG